MIAVTSDCNEIDVGLRKHPNTGVDDYINIFEELIEPLKDKVPQGFECQNRGSYFVHRSESFSECYNNPDLFIKDMQELYTIFGNKNL
jgi:hypothetical protein